MFNFQCVISSLQFSAHILLDMETHFIHLFGILVDLNYLYVDYGILSIVAKFLGYYYGMNVIIIRLSIYTDLYR